MNVLGLSADLCKMVLLITVPAAFPKGRTLARLMNTPADPTVLGVLVRGRPRLGCKGTFDSRLETVASLAGIQSMAWKSFVEAAEVGVKVMALACGLLDSAANYRVIVFFVKSVLAHVTDALL